MTILPSIFHIDLPDALVERLKTCKNNQEIKEIGVQWGIEQSKELKQAGVPCLHYYSMGRSQAVYNIVKEVF